MWVYQKNLQYPVYVSEPNPEAAKIVLSQLGGPDGELGAAMRYLNQRYSIPNRKIAGLLTDIGTEELAHMEMVASLVHQLTQNATAEQFKDGGMADYFVDHTAGIWTQAASGTPFSATVFQSKGDAITDLYEDLAAEQKARTTYDNILRLVKSPEVRQPIQFLREREIVHFQRFGEALEILKDELDHRNFYAFNPSYDTGR